MGRNCGQRWSRLLQIEDEVLAFDFDRSCNLRLQIYDAEMEKRRLEAMSMGAVSSVMGSPQVKVDRDGPIPLNA